MSGSIKYLLIVLIALAPLSCKKIRQIPPEPLIEFRSFAMFDSTDNLGNTVKAGVLEFYFEDGDGDIGLPQPLPGATNPDSTNLKFYLFKKEDGLFDLPDDTIDFRVPIIERIGQNKIIQGTIEISFFYKFLEEEVLSLTDSIKYEFFLVDRAGNISNTSSSCEIVFSGDGGCLEEESPG